MKGARENERKTERMWENRGITVDKDRALERKKKKSADMMLENETSKNLKLHDMFT